MARRASARSELAPVPALVTSPGSARAQRDRPGVPPARTRRVSTAAPPAARPVLAPPALPRSDAEPRRWLWPPVASAPAAPSRGQLPSPSSLTPDSYGCLPYPTASSSSERIRQAGHPPRPDGGQLAAKLRLVLTDGDAPTIPRLGCERNGELGVVRHRDQRDVVVDHGIHVPRPQRLKHRPEDVVRGARE